MKQPKIIKVMDVRDVNLRCQAMAEEIESYGHENLCIITILTGGFTVAAKVIEYMKFRSGSEPIFGFIGLSSYGHEYTSRRSVNISTGLTLNWDSLKNRNIWIIDDISDRGETLEFCKIYLSKIVSESVHTAVLLDKKEVRERNGNPPPDVVGIQYENDDFLIGSGMGIGEHYRHLEGLWKVITTE